MPLATAPIAASSMLGSYVIASRVRSSPGAVAAMAGPLTWCACSWKHDHGTGTAAVLVGAYLTAFGASHALAKTLGAWPAVLAATAFTGAVSHAVAGRR